MSKAGAKRAAEQKAAREKKATMQAEFIHAFFARVGGGYGSDGSIIIFVAADVTREVQERILNELADIVIISMFLSAFPLPDVGKWTKRRPVICRFFYACQCGILKRVARSALGRLVFDETVRTKEQAEEKEIEAQFVLEGCFHKPTHNCRFRTHFCDCFTILDPFWRRPVL